jgi:hypothetical protein
MRLGTPRSWLALLIITAVIWPGLSRALPDSEVERVFFSAADFRQQVGVYVLLCNGGRTKTGQQTRWYLETKVNCRNAAWSPRQCNVCDPGFIRCVIITCPPDIAVQDAN